MRFFMAAAVLLMASPASADWNGFYVGAHAAQAFAESKTHYYGKASYIRGYSVHEDFKAQGQGVGGEIGYGSQFGHWYFGLETDATLLDTEKLRVLDATNRVSVKNSFIGSGRVRIGFAGERFLTYVTAGLAVADFSFGDGGIFNGIGIAFRRSAISPGAVVGGGVEWKVTDDVALRAEALYYMFNDLEVTGHGTVNVSANAQESVVRVGVVFRP